MSLGVLLLNVLRVIKWQIKDETRHFATSVSDALPSLPGTCHREKLKVFTRNWNANKFHMSRSHHIFYKIPSAQWRVLARRTYLEHMWWEKWPYGSDLKTPARHRPGPGFEQKLNESDFMLISKLSMTKLLKMLCSGRISETLHLY